MFRTILLIVGIICSASSFAQSPNPTQSSINQPTSSVDSKPPSLFEQGQKYRHGDGVPKDPQKAMELFNAAIAQGDYDGETGIAFLYELGEGVPKDLAEAITHYQNAASHGSLWGKYWLGMMYSDGNGVPRDPKKSFELISEAANGGLQEAELSMAIAYFNGISAGVDQDLPRFFSIVERLSLNGFNDANYFYGWALATGTGTQKNTGKGGQIITKAASDGDLQAQSFLAQAFYRGQIFAKDLKAAAYWGAKASEQGDVNSMRGYADQLLKGDGIPVSTINAVKWYEKAADQGDKQSMSELGRIYTGNDYKDEGVPMDCKKAEYWTKKGASPDSTGDGVLNQIGEGICSYPEKWIAIQGLLHHTDFNNEKNDHQNKLIYFEIQSKLKELIALKVPAAVCELGTQTHYYGFRFEEDKNDGLDLLLSGAKQGFKSCMDTLIFMGDQGSFEEKLAVDSPELFSWKMRLAELGSTEGMGWVANAYQEGKGVQQDYALAYGWRVLQYERFGLPVDENQFSELSSKLPPKKREAGQKFASEWNLKFGTTSKLTEK